MNIRGWQFFQCLGNGKKKYKNKTTPHSALIAKLQYIYMRWVRPQETIGLLVLEHCLINPNFPYNRRNTDRFIPIGGTRKAESLLLLHQAAVCGCCSSTGHRHRTEMVSEEDPSRTHSLQEELKGIWAQITASGFSLKTKTKTKT